MIQANCIHLAHTHTHTHTHNNNNNNNNKNNKNLEKNYFNACQSGTMQGKLPVQLSRPSTRSFLPSLLRH